LLRVPFLAVVCSSSPNPSCLLPMNPVRASDYGGILADGLGFPDSP
jgi:hypothetical protein